MRFYSSKFEDSIEEKKFRIYVTDALYLSARGSGMGERYIDMIKKKIETRTEDQIILDTIKGAGLKFKEG